MPEKSAIPEITFDFSEFGIISSYHDQEDYGLHTHNFIELVYVINGYGRHRHVDRSYPIIAGDFFVINTREAHGYEKTSRLRIANIIVAQEFLPPYLPLLRKIKGFAALFSLEPLFRDETSFCYKLHLPAESRARIEPMIDTLISELWKKPDGYQAACAGLLLQILAITGRAFSHKGSQPALADFSGKQEAVAQAIAFLESHSNNDISLNDVAVFTCMSGSRLSHVFKETTGTSLMDYLLRYRLDRARELLRAESRSVSDIAYTVGFHDPGYFSRAFKKHFGYSPRQTAD